MSFKTWIEENKGHLKGLSATSDKSKNFNNTKCDCSCFPCSKLKNCKKCVCKDCKCNGCSCKQDVKENMKKSKCTCPCFSCSKLENCEGCKCKVCKCKGCDCLKLKNPVIIDKSKPPAKAFIEKDKSESKDNKSKLKVIDSMKDKFKRIV